VDFRLREFRLEDFDSLWALDQMCFAPGIAYSRLELGSYIRHRSSFTIVAEVADLNDGRGPGLRNGPAIVGFIIAESDRRGIGHIISIDVHPNSRRAQLGTKLLESAEDRLQASACTQIILETAVDNTAALTFYKRHGYAVVKTAPRYYPNGVDAFVLQKPLAGPARNGTESKNKGGG
jgi:[ribosomal protein S18]-alanine N-acetyltransferase